MAKSTVVEEWTNSESRFGTNLIFYDNQIASSDGADLTTPGTLLGGGSIVIHTK
jgi:hypothetical protein